MDVSALLDWYRAHRRRMPWRDEVSPYRTLVSEIMLQQTRVDTVIPYFERFLSDFPTVEALAEAPIERVLERWSGLGYYSRARNLHAAARAVVARGGFPHTVEGLRELPGVGPYTAGAIASIALGLDAPLVDGNVERVLCRQNAWAEDPKRIARRLWDLAGALLPAGQAGDFNQALMELGATICTPANPSCLTCPVRPSCAGVDAPQRYPAKTPPKAVPEASAVAVLARSEGRVLLARRPDTGLLAGLWELPGGPGDELAAVVRERLNVEVRGATLLGEVPHVFSHLRLTTRVYAGEIVGEAAVRDYYTDVRWVPAEQLDGMALSTLARKTLRVGSGVSAAPSRRARRTIEARA
jgi:A/G-specific adenine glycosylase